MKSLSQILLIDDESHNREALSLLLANAGYQVQTAESGEMALEILQKTPFEIVITDLFLPGVNGIDILKRVKEDSPYTNVILITGNASAETAVEAMKEGAFDYITKPFNFEKLKVQVSKALEKSRLVAENLYLRQQLRGKYKFDNIIGNSMAMQQVFSRMEKVVNTDSTILILGESGTGKELVAKAIHYNSGRREKPFVAINCGAIPADLLESELFGHVRGSFTGAVADKAGKFEVANNGTIFLDEIGTMPMHLQMKLLRVLQEQEVERVGSSKKVKLNVRVVSATNANLEDEVKKGRFREDLYYRLNVIPILLPPLRERRRGHRPAGQPFPAAPLPGDGPAADVHCPFRHARAGGLRLAGKRAGDGERHRAHRGPHRARHHRKTGPALQHRRRRRRGRNPISSHPG